MNLFSFFKESLSEANGKPSNIRVVSTTWVLGILVSIVYLTYINKNFPVIPDGVLMSVVGIFGVKAYQKGKEPEKDSEKELELPKQ